MYWLQKSQIVLLLAITLSDFFFLRERNPWKKESKQIAKVFLAEP